MMRNAPKLSIKISMAALICGGLLLAGCGQKSGKTAAAIDPQGAEYAVTDHLGPLDDSPRKPGQQALKATFLEVTGSYRHRGTGLEFPVNVAGFTRSQVMQFGKSDRDVGATYELATAQGLMRAAVYIYPWDSGNSVNQPGNADELQACRETFAETEQATALGFGQRGFHNPKVRQLGRVSASFGKPVDGYAARFDLRGSSGDGLSLLYLYCGVEREWLVKYRFLYPTGFAQADARAATFMAAAPGR
jgi:hypothetical protein